MRIILCLLFSTTVHAATLEVGQSQFFEASINAKIKVTPAKLVEIQEEPGGVRLKAKKTGNLKLIIDGEERNIIILVAGTNSFYKKMKELAKNMLGPNIQMIGGNLRVQGHIHRLSDLKKFAKLSEQWGRPYELRAQLDADLHKELRNQIKTQLSRAGVSSFHLSFDPYPHIEISEEHKLKRIRNILGPYGISYRFSSEQIAVKSLVDIRIVVAEVTKSFQSDLGIDWPTQMSAELNNHFRSHEQLLATLKLAEAKGEGQILASPHVVARSGGKAEFLAGGELPIRVMSRYSKGIQWKRHGIFLRIKPKADLDQNISLEMEAEVSMPDSGYSVDNIPAMKTNRVSSQFDMRAKSTIVLSGLIQNLKSFNEQGLAGLSRIPIIGNFFKSQSHRKTQTELVIFVTPQIRKIDPQKKPTAPKAWKGDFEYL